MAFANANYKIISFSTGTNGPYGVTGSTIVHEVFCMTAGAVTVTAIGGGSLTVSLTAGQSVKVLASGVSVGSGTFCGFGPLNSGGSSKAVRG